MRPTVLKMQWTWCIMLGEKTTTRCDEGTKERQRPKEKNRADGSFFMHTTPHISPFHSIHDWNRLHACDKVLISVVHG